MMRATAQFQHTYSTGLAGLFYPDRGQLFSLAGVPAVCYSFRPNQSFSGRKSGGTLRDDVRLGGPTFLW